MKRREIPSRLIPVLGIGLFLLRPAEAAEGVRSGLRFAGSVLVPSLFPVSVLACCLVRMRVGAGRSRRVGVWIRAVFGVSGNAAVPLALGMIGGFPLGAKLVSDMVREGTLSKEEGARFSGLCTQAGPAFLLGAAASVLGSPFFGTALLLLQLFSTLLTGAILRGTAPDRAALPRAPAAARAPFSRVLPACIGESAVSMLRLTGSVAFFRAATACVGALLPMQSASPLLGPFVSGLLELTGGLELLRGIAPTKAFPLVAALIGWGGLCVHLQAAAFLSDAELPLRPYLRTKLVESAVCIASAVVVCACLEKRFTVQSGISSVVLIFLIFFAVFKKTIGKRRKLCYNQKKAAAQEARYAVS